MGQQLGIIYSNRSTTEPTKASGSVSNSYGMCVGSSVHLYCVALSICMSRLWQGVIPSISFVVLTKTCKEIANSFSIVIGLCGLHGFISSLKQLTRVLTLQCVK